MTQEEFNAMLQVALAQGLPGSYYTSRYGAEETDDLLDKVKSGGISGNYADRKLSNLNTAQEALVNLGASANPNELDNADFTNPVNQREVSGLISSPGYFIDRWKLVSGTVQISENGLILNGTISQIIPDKIGTVYSAVALTTTKLVTCSYDDSSKTFSITGTGETFVAAKLEKSAKQTLAYQESGGALKRIQQPESDYATRLRKCQRYYYRKKYLQYQTINMAYEDSAYAFIMIPLPVEMRTNPAVIQSAPIQLGSAERTLTGVETSGSLAKVSVNFGTIDNPQKAVYSYCAKESGVVFEFSADL